MPAPTGTSQVCGLHTSCGSGHAREDVSAGFADSEVASNASGMACDSAQGRVAGWLGQGCGRRYSPVSS
ncbi:hypothetical protein C5609_10440 [Pseudomonas putida]|nr:hypothetical protein DK184_10980 [Pseudomonas sp. RW405]TFF51997.1 hypothetical protein C5609_10440 [Pseudomonas putida]